MDRTNIYYRQVQFLLQLVPVIARHDCFALKGGTAINLFVRDLPRLSVDIDLVFLPVMARAESLRAIKTALDEIATDTVKVLPGSKVARSYEDKKDALRLTVDRDGVMIKIELSPVLRGTVYDSAIMPVSEVVEEEFGYAEMPVVAFPDLYAGKICAALDRQHPRDLFDVKFLLDNEGLTEEYQRRSADKYVRHLSDCRHKMCPVTPDNLDERCRFPHRLHHYWLSAPVPLSAHPSVQCPHVPPFPAALSAVF